MRRMNVLLLINLLFVAAFTSCSTSSDVSITELPPSENFDAQYGVWNTSGSKILFNHTDLSGDIPKQYQLWVYDVNAKERYIVFDGPSLNPDWNPDEEWIAFHTNSIPEKIFKYSPSSDSLVQLTGDGSSVPYRNTSIARWNPINSQLLFTIIAGDPRGVAILNMDENDAEIVVPFGVGAAWFPDGEHIIYVNWDSDQPYERQRQLYMSKSDGSNSVKLTNLDNSDLVSSPNVSPDGKKVVFVHRASSGSTDLFTLDLDTNEISQLTNTPSHISVFRPQWHPSENKILFTAIITNVSRRLFTINMNTSEIEAVFPEK